MMNVGILQAGNRANYVRFGNQKPEDKQVEPQPIKKPVEHSHLGGASSSFKYTDSYYLNLSKKEKPADTDKTENKD